MSKTPLENGSLQNVRTSEVPEEQVEMLRRLVKGHAIGEKYDPKYLGAGSEQILYSIPEHLGIVVKAGYLTFRKSIDWNVAHGQPADSLSSELKQSMEQDISRERRRYERIRDRFGFDHVLPQRKYVIKLPTSRELLDAVYGRTGEKPPAVPQEAPSVLTVQKRSEALQDPESLTLVYRDGMKNPTVQTLLDRSKTDEGLRRCLIEFSSHCIEFTKKTGEILDMGMPDNIIFYRKEGQWTYEIIDGVYPNTENIVEAVQEALKKKQASETLTKDEAVDLENGTDYVDTINGLAEQLGLKERILQEKEFPLG